MRVALWLLLAGAIFPAGAQNASGDEREPPWYRVELIVFQYLEPGADTETWPASPDLAYPPELQHLRDGDSDIALATDFELLRIEDALPAPAFDLAWDKSVAQLLREYRESMDPLSASAPLPVLEAAEEPGDEAAQDGIQIGPRLLTVPRAFVSRDAQAKEFYAQARRIRGSRDMRLLFHDAWLQPMRERNDSVPLVVDSVIKHGDYPALQGSLLLYVSRYLHLETNLWLNTGAKPAGAPGESATDNDEEPGAASGTFILAGTDWSIPAPPAPPKPYTPSPWSFTVALETGFADDIELSPARDGEMPTVDSMAAAGGAPPGAMVGIFDPAPSLQPIQINRQRLGQVDLELFLDTPWYPFARAVPVRQTRRMRSGEIHYLDHPLLGVILKISPYEFEPFTPVGESSPELAAGSTSFR